jgi:hypothetical protein
MLLLAGLAAIGIVGLKSAGIADEVEAVMDVARPWLYAAQLTFTAVVWIRWPRIVKWLAARGRIAGAAIDPLLRARHRLMALVLLIQLTVGMGLPLSLF